MTVCYRAKRIIPYILLISILCLLLTAAAPAEASGYSDVPSDAWYSAYVTELSGRKIVSGYPDGTFRPSGSVTLGEALKLVLLAAGYGERPGTDAHWSAGYAEAAVSSGLLTADEAAELDAPASRLTVARLAAKALGLIGSGAASPFLDVTDGCVTALYNAGIIEGSTENGVLSFRPDSEINRAEAGAVVSRILAAADTLGPGYIRFSKQTLAVKPNVPLNSLAASEFYFENGFAKYGGGVETRSGVDVSSYQGVIDWQRVASSGVDFAMLRLGGRGYGSGEIYEDSQFEANLRGALAAGLDVGVYFFSQAITEAEAVEEAELVLSKIRGFGISCPVVFDWENIGGAESRTNGLDTDTLCRCADAFCSAVKTAGYSPAVYFNQYLGYVAYDLSRLTEYAFWYAEYNTSAPTFRYGFDMWQYTSAGSVDGIEGKVDLNLMFVK